MHAAMEAMRMVAYVEGECSARESTVLREVVYSRAGHAVYNANTSHEYSIMQSSCEGEDLHA